MTDNAFPQAERDAIYRTIAERRDMRHFTGGTVEPALLRRLLEAAHQAPSVGLMQPWRFIRISDRALRGQIRQLVEQERIRTAEALGERSDEFMRSEEHTSELQSLMRISYAVFCLKKKKQI